MNDVDQPLYDIVAKIISLPTIFIQSQLPLIATTKVDNSYLGIPPNTTFNDNTHHPCLPRLLKSNIRSTIERLH